MAKLSQKCDTPKLCGEPLLPYLFFFPFQHYFKDHYSPVRNIENALSACITIALSNTKRYTLKK